MDEAAALDTAVDMVDPQPTPVEHLVRHGLLPRERLPHIRINSIKVKRPWRYLYRAVDKQGQTIDFLLTEKRDEEAALRFLKQAIGRHGVPERSTIDGSATNEAAIKSYHEAHGTAIVIRQVKYLHNVVEQDHRAVKRVTRLMLGFKSIDAAQSTLTGMELMHMSKKRQWISKGGQEGLPAAEQFYALAASFPSSHASLTPSVYTQKFATKPLITRFDHFALLQTARHCAHRIG